MERRVVITACAAITPIGNTEAGIWESLERGRSGVKALRQDEMLGKYIHSRVFGTVDYPIAFEFERQYRKTMGPVSFYACQVAKEVLTQAQLPDELLASGRMGVAFGSTHGSPTVQRAIYETFFSGNQSKVRSISAAEYLKSMVHTTAVNITKMFHITGRVIASSTACTTSSQSIGYGYEAIKFGLQEAMLCGGADEYDLMTVAVFDNLLACSTAFNDTPELTPRPFDRRRDGLVVGEGAGAVLLESLEHAQRRGAPILGEVIGFACGNNGGDLILPNAQGVERTIRMALESAGLEPQQVDLISAHATATRMGDIIEAQAMGAIYGSRPWVTALKSYMGHTMGSCGAIETILLLAMMKRGAIAPTLHLEEIDERCGMVRHVQKLVEQPVEIASVQNFAFGGVNTCLFLKRFS